MTGTVWHRNTELEAAILDDRESVDGLQAYAAWLTEREDPRGSMIAAHVTAAHKPRSRKLKAEARQATEAFMRQHHPGLAFPQSGAMYETGRLKRVQFRMGLVAELDLRGLQDPVLLDEALRFLAQPVCALIEKLSLTGSGVRDLSGVAGTGLRWIQGNHNPHLQDIGPLASLERLELLDLAATGVSDLSPLTGLPRLQFVNLMSTPVADISPLQSISTLREAILLQTKVDEIQVGALKKAVPALRKRGKLAWSAR